MVPVLIFLYICVTEPTDPETPSAEKPTESDCKTEEENIHSNPTRLSSTNSIALLSVARPLGGTIRLPPEPWQCEFSDDSRIKTSGGPPAAAKADPLCCPPSCSPSLSLRNCELRNTTQGGTNCAAANIRPHAEWNRVVATTMVKESYANKICSFVRRLGSIIIPVVSVTIEKSTCGCDKPSYHQLEGIADQRRTAAIARLGRRKMRAEFLKSASPWRQQRKNRVVVARAVVQRECDGVAGPASRAGGLWV